MFEALGHTLKDGHLDLSFRDPSGWAKVGPLDDMPPSLFVSLGDPVTGPDIQFVVIKPPAQDVWLRTHYHGSDQFRAILQGGWKLQLKRMQPAQFSYQVSGVPYREGLAHASDDLWMFAAHGERRGARSTHTRKDATWELSPERGEDQLDRCIESPEDPYWDGVPGGSKGTIGLKTTLGRAVGGFNWGSFDDTANWRQLSPGVSISAGVMSDPVSGPIFITLRSEPGRTAIPAAIYGTEFVLVVVRGSCDLGDRTYIHGEARIQEADVALDAIVAGPDGLDAILVIADRRCPPRVASSDAGAGHWPAEIDRLIEELTPAFA